MKPIILSFLFGAALLWTCSCSNPIGGSSTGIGSGNRGDASLFNPDGGGNAAPTDPEDGYRCGMNFQVSSFTPDSCSGSDAFDGQEVDLEWSCGDGPARLEIADMTLVGSVNGDQVILSGARQDPETLDGSTQTLDAFLDLSTDSGSLAYRYDSTDPVTLQPTDCQSAAPVMSD